MSTDKTETVIIAVYVDDILIAAKTDERIAEIKAAIAKQFIMLFSRSQSCPKFESRDHLVWTTCIP